MQTLVVIFPSYKVCLFRRQNDTERRKGKRKKQREDRKREREKREERDREKEKENISISRLLPKSLHQPLLNQFKARSQKFHPSLLYGW